MKYVKVVFTEASNLKKKGFVFPEQTKMDLGWKTSSIHLFAPVCCNKELGLRGRRCSLIDFDPMPLATD